MGSRPAVKESTVSAPRQPPGTRRPGRQTAHLVPHALSRAVDRTDRLEALTRELHSAGRQGRTSAWLAERLNVSARTVKRDVTALQQAGVPIRASSGPQGGYAIDTAAAGPPVRLTPEEAIAVVVGLQAVPDQPFEAAGRSVISKVLHALDPAERDDVIRAASQVWIRPGESPVTPDGDIRAVLAQATRDHQVVIVDYESDDTSRTLTRQLEPLGFAHSRGLWFVLAWCREDDGGRWIQLDRIRAAQPTHEAFKPRDVREVFGQ